MIEQNYHMPILRSKNGGAGSATLAAVDKGEAVCGHAVLIECGRRERPTGRREDMGGSRKLRWKRKSPGEPGRNTERENYMRWIMRLSNEKLGEPGGAAHKRRRNKAMGSLEGNKSKPAALKPKAAVRATVSGY